MAKLYSKPSSGNKKMNQVEPRKETLDFLLNFSKAFKCYSYKTMKFEAFIN